MADADIVFLLCGFFLSLFFFFPRLISAAADWMSTILRHVVWPYSANLECRSEMCCARLAGNAGPKNLPKSCHLGTIAQLCRDYLLHVSPQYGELWPTSGCDLLASLGHPCKFQLVSRLGSVTAWHSSSGHQPNFAALNRGRHLY